MIVGPPSQRPGGSPQSLLLEALGVQGPITTVLKPSFSVADDGQEKHLDFQLILLTEKAVKSMNT